ncbi:hypothetical protein [Caldovatus sediminis]|nr:hypothetical protein [Caldovatus sediminis]
MRIEKMPSVAAANATCAAVGHQAPEAGAAASPAATKPRKAMSQERAA